MQVAILGGDVRYKEKMLLWLGGAQQLVRLVTGDRAGRPATILHSLWRPSERRFLCPRPSDRPGIVTWRDPLMVYQPIENYGIIGDMYTVALVGIDGSIDWFCYPHFDSPSIFGSILDEGKGGRFRITTCARGPTASNSTGRTPTCW